MEEEEEENHKKRQKNKGEGEGEDKCGSKKNNKQPVQAEGTNLGAQELHNAHVL